MNKDNINIHPAQSRGHMELDWLNAYHSFSFAEYFNRDRMGFGLLRVLNDDTIQAAQGFETHAHQNMEIISIPLQGALEHKDNQGHSQVIQSGDIQVMSAGSGISHSEFNASKKNPVNLLQIWIQPKHLNITPRYDQRTYEPTAMKDQLLTVVSPQSANAPLWINQDAWLSIGVLSAGKKYNYKIKIGDVMKSLREYRKPSLSFKQKFNKEKVFSMSEDITVRDLAMKMSTMNVGFFVTTDDNGKITGCVSERDIVRRAVIKDLDLDKTPISEILTRDLIQCSLESTLQEALYEFKDNHIRHLPIIDQVGKVLGIMTERDINHYLLFKFTLQEFEEMMVQAK